jgi:hypothetical protein
MTFIEHGGIETIVKIIDQINSNKKINIRAIELMNDLIAEKVKKNNAKKKINDFIWIFIESNN